MRALAEVAGDPAHVSVVLRSSARGTPLPCGRACGRGRSRARRARARRRRSARAARDRRAAGRAPRRAPRADRGATSSAGHAVVDRFGDRADRRRHHGNRAGHRLHDRLRHAFLAVRRQREEVERLQPGHDVLLLAGEADGVGETERREPRGRAGRGTARRRRRAPATRATRRGRARSPRTGTRGPSSRAAWRRCRASGRGGRPSRARAAAASPGTKRARSMPVGTEVMRSSGMRVVARELSAQRLAGGDDVRGRAHVEPARAGRLWTVVDTWRVRTIGGACGSVAQASAPSQLSVELWVLRTSTSRALRREPAAQREERRAGASSGSAGGTTVSPRSFTPAAAIGASGGAISVTPVAALPASPRASVRMRISCPPQPQEFSVWTIESAALTARIGLVAREPAFEDQQHPQPHRVVLAARCVLGEQPCDRFAGARARAAAARAVRARL